MNPKMILRAIDRHRYMQDLPPYREFLEYVRTQRDVWCATQAEFATWWKARESARLRLESFDPDRLRVSSDLPQGAVQLGGDLPQRLPLELTIRGDGSAPHLLVQLHHAEVIRSLVRHLGCAHVELRDGEDPLLAPVCSHLEDYLAAGVVSARAYPAPLVDAMRTALERAHERAGLPMLRLWTLPVGPDGRPYRAAFSPRFDVDKAMVNVPLIARLHAEFDVRGTFYVRPLGVFYGRSETRKWAQGVDSDEFALHGEFVTTGAQRFGDEWGAAIGEKALLEEILEREVVGVSTHGGELLTNQTPNTPSATDRAGFLYESTFYERPYYLPMYLPSPEGIRPTLTMLRHQDDVSLPLTADFGRRLTSTFEQQFGEAQASGGIFVPAMHPLYFDLGNYLRQPTSWVRLTRFAPTFAVRAARMKRGQLWANQRALYGE